MLHKKVERREEQVSAPKDDCRGGKNNERKSSVSPVAIKPPTGQLDDAVDFLKHWTPDGPWVLSAIAPDKRGLTGETFTPSSEKQLTGWLRSRIETHNIYFTVNPLMRSISGNAKASK